MLVADDLGPADVAELDGAVVADRARRRRADRRTPRSSRAALGIPLVVGLGPELLDARPRRDRGRRRRRRRRCSSRPRRRSKPRARRSAARLAERRAGAGRARPARGHARRPARARARQRRDRRRGRAPASAAGAEGVGLMRTELAFLDARGLARRGGAPRGCCGRCSRGSPAAPRPCACSTSAATSCPRSSTGSRARGLALLLGAPEALAAQLRAIAAEGAATELRVLLPIAERRRRRRGGARAAPGRGVAIGAMVETVAAVEAAAELAAAADFLSIGTNDLAHAAVGSDRFAGAAPAVHDPRVLALIARTAAAARRRGRPARGVRRRGVRPDRRAAARRARRRRAVASAPPRSAACARWVRGIDHGTVRRMAREALSLGQRRGGRAR